MKTYEIVLLVLVVCGVILMLRQVMKASPARISSPIAPVASITSKRMAEQSVSKTATSRPTPSQSRVEDDDFGTSFASGIATGVLVGRNLTAGMLGAAIHHSSSNVEPSETERESSSRGEEDHSHSSGDSSSSDSSSSGGGDSSSSSGGD